MTDTDRTGPPSFVGYPCIFELAVYRVDPKTWERECKAQAKRLVLPIPAWAYNDVVGWIRLSTSHRRIKGYLQWRDASRLLRPLVRPSQRFYAHRGKVLDLITHDKATDAEIYIELIKRLHGLLPEPGFKGRYIDTTALEAIGPHIAWRTLVGSRYR